MSTLFLNIFTLLAVTQSVDNLFHLTSPPRTRYICTSTRYVCTSTRYICTSTRYICTSKRYICTSTRYICTRTRYICTSTRYTSCDLAFSVIILMICGDTSPTCHITTMSHHHHVTSPPRHITTTCKLRHCYMQLACTKPPHITTTSFL